MPRAGLDVDAVTRAAAELIDEQGLSALTMTALAERVGVRPPSLYKHVPGGLPDLIHRVATLAAQELAALFRDARSTQGGAPSLTDVAAQFRRYVTVHPGRYAATSAAEPTGDDDPLAIALHDSLDALAGVLDRYGLPRQEHVHAIRMLRSVLHGFAVLDAARGFRIDVDVDASVAWSLDLMDAGLRSARQAR
ncbi:TetR/AcrR family transcriptional regulator [Microbacterium sp. NPDC091382]|uniref:TetR/AcrR family transcriptional regulator n=1 Tax=Microbacterium sp. NPDC091382 TaxID=3364210 RepID=UPI0037F31F51